MNNHRMAYWGALLGLLCALVAYAPAQWLADGLNALSRGHVQLRDAQGTIWRGHAQWVLTSGPGGQDAVALPQRLHWQLKPHWASLQLHLNAECCTPQPLQLQLQPVWMGVQISLDSPRSVWPAQWLSGLGAPWNTLALTGLLQLQTQALNWTWQHQGAAAGQLSGQVQLHLQQLSSGLSTMKPLGSYKIQLEGGERPTLTLSTTQGQLLLQGQGVINAKGFSFEGEARANTGHESALANLLGVLGQRVGNRTVMRWG